MLLFLKHVVALEVFSWQPDATAPERLFTCTLLDAEDTSLQGARARFVHAASAMASGEAAMASQLALGVTLHNVAFSMQAAGGQATLEQFLVAQSAGDARAAAMARHVGSQLGTRVIPWGAVAARMAAQHTGFVTRVCLCRSCVGVCRICVSACLCVCDCVAGKTRGALGT